MRSSFYPFSDGNLILGYKENDVEGWLEGDLVLSSCLSMTYSSNLETSQVGISFVKNGSSVVECFLKTVQELQ